MVSNIGSKMTIARTQAPVAAKATEKAVAPEAKASVANDGSIVSQSSLRSQKAYSLASSQELAGLEKELANYEYEPGEVIVKVNDQVGLAAQNDFYEKFGVKLEEKFDLPKDVFKGFNGEVVRVSLPEGVSVAEAMAAMKQDSRVSYVEPNAVSYLQAPVQEEAAGTPNDLTDKLWGLDNKGQLGGKVDADIDAPEAWTIQKGKTQAEGGHITAVIDTGIDYNHEDLQANMWVNTGEIPGNGIDDDGNGVIDDVHGYNAYADSGDPMDGNSHGTHCAGTIAGVGDNGKGVTGVGQKGNLMAIKIFSDAGRTNTSAILRGISYASKNGARITSNSWGGGRPSEAIKEAFASSPAFHFMAAGNSGTDNDRRPHFPSNYGLANSLGVAASDRNDRLANFSCYGETTVDLAAPGKDIYSTVPGNKYASYSGTSMATPHVTGAAAVLLAENPEMSNAELRERLLGGVDHVKSFEGKLVTEGRLNLYNSLTMEVNSEGKAEGNEKAEA